jgi:hypothetical protein
VVLAMRAKVLVSVPAVTPGAGSRGGMTRFSACRRVRELVPDFDLLQETGRGCSLVAA